jgi:hypothetical protein
MALNISLLKRKTSSERLRNAGNCPKHDVYHRWVCAYRDTQLDFGASAQTEQANERIRVQVTVY